MRPTGDWMQTASGRSITWPIQADDIVLEDVVQHLSKQCRYNGATPVFYSVAEHSTLLAQWALDQGDEDLARALWWHDAGEAYIADMPRPLKYQLDDYMVVDAQADDAVAKRSGLDWTPSIVQQVKLADWRIITDEKLALFPTHPKPWNLNTFGPLGVPVVGLEWFDAAYEYEQMANTLGVT